MNLIHRTATAVVAALALSVPTAAITATASNAAPAGVSHADQHSQIVGKKAKKKVKLKLKRSAKYSHVGQTGVKLTAVAKKGKKKAKGKVTFTVNGAAVAKKKLRKGKASYRLASTNAPGVYTVTAKYKGKKKSTKVRVYNSAISLSAVEFTVSQATDSWDLPAMTGTVQYKDKPANDGYVDIYKDGNKKGGSSSPDYCCMASVADNGAFEFGGYSFLAKVQEMPVGDYTFQAFYTETASFAEYIYSSPIVVHVVP
ncbi:Ig-like domain repeat protein [Nocardioides sp. YIM 152315]|uniref:Ig-like domain repeat protein n=1 Tax=Nocardioides sp. YIM 152315 TaxID=3031760 RepID=UPI0023DBF32E|nr:Ig-like domain repeat protein [Nocardioides sp. YIM 152315]MDF1605133.1 Ig-like domain repeat protein [Nocardioides sp. YIM 152315]